MPRPLEMPINRPKCACGRTTHLSGSPQDVARYRKDGRWHEGPCYPVACPDYGTDKPDHLHGVCDIDGEFVELPRRRFKWNPEKYPKCAGCGRPMRTHRAKRTRSGPARSFACGNRRCLLYDKNRTYLGDWETGWNGPVQLPRGPRPSGADLTCLRCRKQGTLQSRSTFKPTRDFPQEHPRYECLDEECRELGDHRATYRLVDGKLEPTARPGFQRKYEQPECRGHRVPMERRRGNSPRLENGKLVHRWFCPRRGCDQTIVLDSEGNPIDFQPRRTIKPRWRKCSIPGCPRPVENPDDGRNHSCAEHRKLTRIQRFRLKQKRLEDFVRDGDKRASVTVVGGPLATKEARAIEFGRWLRAKLDERNISFRAVAERAELPETTVWNWTFGKVMPPDESAFVRLGKVLACTLDDFYADIVKTYRRDRSGASRSTR